jgi:hypothetical protein
MLNFDEDIKADRMPLDMMRISSFDETTSHSTRLSINAS